MIDKLTSLKKITSVVADTGDVNEIKLYNTQHATTNPTLILQAIQLNKYNKLIANIIKLVKKNNLDKNKQMQEVCDRIIVSIGTEILKIISGRISTEIDARLSYDTNASVKKAKKLVKLYKEIGVDKKSILIKLASTWQGIRAAEQLENEGINCNLTLLFSFAQARACAEAKVFLISPFIGRILDWFTLNKQKKYEPTQDPGVLAVSKIYKYYKKHGYKTLIMGASFRNIDEILQLAGCDMLTISPSLLKKLSTMTGKVNRKLVFNDSIIDVLPNKMTESEFLWDHHQDEMAISKLSEGIRNFAIDQEKLEKIIYDSL